MNMETIVVTPDQLSEYVQLDVLNDTVRLMLDGLIAKTPEGTLILIAPAARQLLQQTLCDAVLQMNGILQPPARVVVEDIGRARPNPTPDSPTQ